MIIFFFKLITASRGVARSRVGLVGPKAHEDHANDMPLKSEERVL